jgi:hypothetical protein
MLDISPDVLRIAYTGDTPGSTVGFITDSEYVPCGVVLPDGRLQFGEEVWRWAPHT